MFVCTCINNYLSDTYIVTDAPSISMSKTKIFVFKALTFSGKTEKKIQ